MNSKVCRASAGALVLAFVFGIPSSRAEFTGRVVKSGAHARLARPAALNVAAPLLKLKADAAGFNLKTDDLMLKSRTGANGAAQAAETSETSGPGPLKSEAGKAAALVPVTPAGPPSAIRALVDYAAIEAAYSELTGGQAPPLAGSAIATPASTAEQRLAAARAAGAYASRPLVSVHRGSTTGTGTFSPSVDVDNCGCGVPIPTQGCMQQNQIGIGQQMAPPTIGTRSPIYNYGGVGVGTAPASTGASLGASVGAAAGSGTVAGGGYPIGTSTGGWR